MSEKSGQNEPLEAPEVKPLQAGVVDESKDLANWVVDFGQGIIDFVNEGKSVVVVGGVESADDFFNKIVDYVQNGIDEVQKQL